tara:strand:- start:105 stop:758 length:654 start_codon:yes stop_codon:yes gene_type:complete
LLDYLSLENYINKGIEESIPILVLLISSFLVRYLLEISGQSWIKTTSHTFTLAILPIITYIITIVISGNISLSLGMVGALSIVRFRNPVRSPLELSVYFASIAMGITASVSIFRLIFFDIAIVATVLFTYLISLFSRKFLKREFLTTSFSEGNSLSTLEVKVKNNIPILNESKLLRSKNVIGNVITYLLVSNDFKKLKELIYEIEIDENILEYHLNE